MSRCPPRLASSRSALTSRPQPKTITFTHRSANYVIRSHQAAFPFTSRLDIPYIIRFGEKLLQIAIGAGDKLTAIGPDTKIGPYSNIQLSFSGLEKLEEGQKGIEGFFTAGPSKPVKREKDDATESKAKRRKVDDDAQDRQEKDEATTEQETLILPSSPPPDPALSLPTFTCPKCSKTISLPSSAVDSLRPGFDLSAAALLLQKEKDEHSDFHFARDMMEQERKKTFASTTKGGAKGGATKSAGGKSGKGSSTKAPSKPTGKGQQSLTSFFG